MRVYAVSRGSEFDPAERLGAASYLACMRVAVSGIK